MGFDDIKHFKPEEFDSGTIAGPRLSGSGYLHMDPLFIKMLDDLRESCDFPFNISSGYRTPEYNHYVSKSGDSGPHTTGRAVDILVSGENALKLIQNAVRLGFTGIGVNQRGNYSSRFVHIDNLPSSEGRPRPHIWSY